MKLAWRCEKSLNLVDVHWNDPLLWRNERMLSFPVYLAAMTRHSFAMVTCELAQFLSQPRPPHGHATLGFKRIWWMWAIWWFHSHLALLGKVAFVDALLTPMQSDLHKFTRGMGVSVATEEPPILDQCKTATSPIDMLSELTLPWGYATSLTFWGLFSCCVEHITLFYLHRA